MEIWLCYFGRVSIKVKRKVLSEYKQFLIVLKFAIIHVFETNTRKYKYFNNFKFSFSQVDLNVSVIIL